MNRTWIVDWKIVYTPKENDDILFIEETKEVVEKLSYKEVMELIKKYINKLLNN